MSAAFIAIVENQAFWAWSEADESNVWFTEVRFKQWGFAERFIVTAAKWMPF